MIELDGHQDEEQKDLLQNPAGDIIGFPFEETDAKFLAHMIIELPVLS